MGETTAIPRLPALLFLVLTATGAQPVWAQLGPGTSRGIGPSYEYRGPEYWDLHRKPTARPRPPKRGIKSSPTNVLRSRCERASAETVLRARGAFPTRIGAGAPARARSLEQFRDALRRAAAAEQLNVAVTRKQPVPTATPPSCIARTHRHYRQAGLYRGTIRDTYRGITIIGPADPGGRWASADSFWFRFILAKVDQPPFFKWLYHNWQRLDQRLLAQKLGQERYARLVEQMATIKRWGIPASAESYHVLVPDRVVLEHLAQHPEQEQSFYVATFELDTDQS